MLYGSVDDPLLMVATEMSRFCSRVCQTRFARPLVVVLLVLLQAATSRAEIITSLPDKSSGAAKSELDVSVRAGDLTKARQVIVQTFPNIDRIEVEVKIAESLLGQGKVNEARALLDPFLYDDAPRWDVHLTLGKVALLDRHWSDAWIHARIAEASKLPKADSKDIVDKVRDEVAIIKIQSAEARGNWKVVESLASSLMVRSPTMKQGPIALAKAKFELGDIETAEKLLIELHVNSPELPSPSLILAKFCDAKSDYEVAEQYFVKAVAESTVDERSVSQTELARFYLWRNRPDEILELLKESFTDPTLDRERQFLLASAARMKGDFGTAEVLLTSLHQEDATNFSISNCLALVLVESRNETLRARALQIAQANARNFQQTADAWATLGWIQFRLGDIRASQESLSVAIQAGTINRDTAYFLSEVSARLGNAEEAARLREAAQTAPGPFFYQDRKPSGS